jgi:predicted ATP-grasp superfamily ATP-dependent carboligase
VSEHREALAQHFILAESMRSEVNSLFTNKHTFYERCQNEDVAMPRTFFPKDEAEAREAAQSLRYPAIVKPTLGHLFRRKLKGNKLVEVAGPEDLLHWWRQFREWGGESVLQEVISGPEANIFVAALYTDAQGECRSIFTARKTRQYPPMYGSGSYMEACWSEEIAELSIDLIRKLGYKGICGSEFKWDERDREWKLIEVNTRPTLWFSLTRAAGVDVVWDAYCDLVGRPNPVHANCQDDRVRWQLPIRDLVSGLHFWRKGELGFGAFLRSVVDPRRKDFGDVSFRDPGTLIGLPANTLYKYTQNVRGEEKEEQDG